VRRARAAIAGTVALLTGGCGTPSADLFVVSRSGSIPAAKLTLLVSDDGSVVCNGGPRRPISSEQLITARSLERDLAEPATKRVSLAPGARTVMSYQVRSGNGTLRFSDTSRGQPPAFFRLALFTREIAKGVCKLPR
jgi:hypothetical protein